MKIESTNRSSGSSIRAAQYVRMSTEHQKYSTENQSEVIKRYADARGMEIVHTYADEGKSGLSFGGRDALQRLIDDVRSRRANFSRILVYDISRWGRFQDADESAYYEFICKEAGISVDYCAEQFENDGSLSATIIKNMKRAMAGEYSRELSTKVFAGQCRLITLGFRQGGMAGYGLRRILVDEQRNPKGTLAQGERKSLQTDRVILAPGPQEELEVVRRIYHLFVKERVRESEIAQLLNRDGLNTNLGRPWTRDTVHQVLTNEKYIGNNVYNHVSFKLKKVRVVNPPDMWIRADSAFQAIVDVPMFEAAQHIIDDRRRFISNDEMLDGLRRLLDQKGRLSGIVIDEAENIPLSSAYKQRFGSLIRAYALIGYDPGRDYRYIDINRSLRLRHAETVADTIRELEAVGARVVHMPNDLLAINDEFTTSVVIARCTQTPGGTLRWKARLEVGLSPHITIAVRMEETNDSVLDYYILPMCEMQESRLRLARTNGLGLESFRFDSLQPFFSLTQRSPLRSVA